MKICIEELGTHHFQWFDLPITQNEIQDWIDKELNDIYIENNLGGIPEEFEVVDTEEIPYLGSFTSYQTYNDYYELLQEQDEVLIAYSIDNLGIRVEELMKDSSSLDDLVKYECDIAEYVDIIIEEGLFGDIPDKLKFYIDTDKIARDLIMGGDVNEFTYNNTDYIIY